MTVLREQVQVCVYMCVLAWLNVFSLQKFAPGSEDSIELEGGWQVVREGRMSHFQAE